MVTAISCLTFMSDNLKTFSSFQSSKGARKKLKPRWSVEFYWRPFLSLRVLKEWNLGIFVIWFWNVKVEVVEPSVLLTCSPDHSVAIPSTQAATLPKHSSFLAGSASLGLFMVIFTPFPGLKIAFAADKRQWRKCSPWDTSGGFFGFK